MSQTLTQYFADKPRLLEATKHLQYNKKLRRLVAQSIEKLHPTTSKVDLAGKVINELSSDKTLNFLFGEEKLKHVTKENLIYQSIEIPVTIACEAFTGLKSKSTYEAELYWYRSSIHNVKMKHHNGNLGVHLADNSDKNRVYITDPNTEVAIVNDVVPYLLLDKNVADRNKLQTPRQVVVVKMSPVDALLLFHSFGDDVQRRIIVPIERVKHFNFKPITDYIQKGLQLEPKELFGTEFEVNALGDLVGEKREGKNPMVWVLDITNRGRKGDQGAKGARGEKGKDGDAGKSFLEQLANAKVDTTINPEATQEEKMNQLFSLLLVKCARDKLAGYDIRGEVIAKREHEFNMKAIRGEPQ